MTVKEIYDTMRAAGLANSQMEFSSIWLGRSTRYYSHLIASHREPGLATLNGVLWRIDSFVRSSPAPDAELERLKNLIAADIACRAITDRQKRNW